MRREMDRVLINGTIVIAEAERDRALVLHIGARVGNLGVRFVDRFPC